MMDRDRTDDPPTYTARYAELTTLRRQQLHERLFLTLADTAEYGGASRLVQNTARAMLDYAFAIAEADE